MRILVADDDRAGATILAAALERQRLEVEVAYNGKDAWRAITHGGIAMAIVDWMMPDVDGLELCRRIREDAAHAAMHVILLTSRAAATDIVAGLDAGADDYLIKPFNPEELRARVQAGARVLSLQERLGARVRELQEALAKVKELRGLLPMCSYCKRIRSDDNYWEQVEAYISQHTDAHFSHGICPVCYEAVRAEFEGTTP